MNEPSVDPKSRDSLITWLVWNDRNGCYTDIDCANEGMEKLSYSAALQLYLSQSEGWPWLEHKEETDNKALTYSY